MKMNLLAIVLAIGLVIVSLYLLINERNITITNTQQKDSISVTGNAELSVSPDEAKINIRIYTFDETAKLTQEKNTEISNKVIKVLKDKKIKEIETVQYYLTPRQIYDEKKSEYIIQGYELNHVLEVTINKIDEAGEIIDLAINNGANGIDRVEFTLSKEKQKDVNNEILKIATQNAKEKAENIAKSLNLNLGKVISVSESNFIYRPYEYLSVRSFATEKTIIQPEQVEVQANVNVIFEIK